MNRVLGLAPRRSIPAFERSLYRWFRTRSLRKTATRDGRSAGGTPTLALPAATHLGAAGRPVVVLYADCFVTYNEPGIGVAAVRVLEACGYEVRLPKVGCCGRAMMSTGLLPEAIRAADGALGVLTRQLEDPRVKAVVVCEPSCLSAIKDDWLHLKLATPMDARKRVAAASFLVEEFVDAAWDSHPLKPRFTRPAGENAGDGGVVLHGHCHQKALGSDASSAKPLRRVAGEAAVTTLASGCCGMAGSFGYLAHRYELSMKIGELSVFPPVRAASAATTICAPGTSCRHQILDGTGRKAIHPIEYMAERLEL